MIVPSVVAVIAVLLIGGVLLWLDPPAAVIVVALALLLGMALPLAMRRFGAPAGQAIAAATARLRTRIVEGVQGLAELKVYQADGHHAEEVLAENETLMAAQRHMARMSGISTALSGLGLLVLSGWYIAASALVGATAATAVACNFTGASAGIGGFAVLRTGSRYAERLVTHDVTFRYLAGLRVWLFRTSIPLAPARLEEQRGGDLLNRMTADVDSLDAIYRG